MGERTGRLDLIADVVVVVTLFIQGGPFSFEAGIQRGPVRYNFLAVSPKMGPLDHSELRHK